jgi:hypothetical protein
VPEESQPKECEGATMVTLGSPSLVPLGSYLSFRTFISRSKGLGGKQQATTILRNLVSCKSFNLQKQRFALSLQ